MSKTEPMGSREEITASLRARAVELWGQKRADALQPGIELTASHVWQLSKHLPPSDAEPGFYF
jgi:hypothetical protein